MDILASTVILKELRVQAVFSPSLSCALSFFSFFFFLNSGLPHLPCIAWILVERQMVSFGLFIHSKQKLEASNKDNE
jgi:hypothetical protein